jgi:toxin-antitoxin system PIN domain toxin
VTIALLDVNVLVALSDAQHIHHAEAHRWLGQNQKYGWATCPLTINGCVRILSSSGYPVKNQRPADIAILLRDACNTPDHHFWPDSVSLLDESLFKMSAVSGHKNITDAYLLGLAVRNHGRLATFDRSIPVHAVPSARPGNLALIGRT